MEITNKAHKRHVKAQYDKFVKPRIFFEGDLVLVYDQANDTLLEGKFVSMWQEPYIIKCVFAKRT